MLREEVLRSWKNLAQKLKKEREIIELVLEKMTGTSLIPDFSSPNFGFKEIEKNLNYWISDTYRITKLETEKQEVISKVDEITIYNSSLLQLAYFNHSNMFEKLTIACWRAINKK